MRWSRRARLAAPFAVAALIGLGSAAPRLTPGQDAHVAPTTPAALLQKMARASADGVSGTVSLTVNVGLPADLSALIPGHQASAAGVDWASFLSGTNKLEIAVGGAGQQRVVLARKLGETDVVHDGDQVWVYNSTTERVTRVLVVAPGPGGHPAAGRGPNPAILGLALLARLLPTTAITLGPPVVVAHRAAYTLRLVPKPATAAAADSTISRIDVAVDAATGFPLRLELFPTSAAAPAFSLGFVGHVSFGRPAAGTFAAPHGASEGTEDLTGLLSGLSGGAGGSTPGAAHPAGGSPDVRGAGSIWDPIVVVADVHLGLASGLVRLLTTPTVGVPGAPRLLKTSLLDVLVYPDGRIVAGLATPAALEAAASAAP